VPYNNYVIPLQPAGEDSEEFRARAAEFLLQWGAFSGLLMRELTLQNAASFGMGLFFFWWGWRHVGWFYVVVNTDYNV